MTEAQLNTYLGKHIRDICPIGFHGDEHNHCAHFVSHIMGYQFGATCRTMVVGQGAKASIRVHELFAHCLMVGRWEDGIPTPLFTGLVFITNAGNVRLATKTMDNVPRKHVGIFCGGARRIWHYSNSRRQVVSQTPDEFSHHYAAPDNAMFWASAP